MDFTDRFPVHAFCLVNFYDQLYDSVFQTTVDQVAAVVASAAALELGRELLRELQALERHEMVQQVNKCRLSFLHIVQQLIDLPGSLDDADIVRQHVLVVITALTSNNEAVIDSASDVLEEVIHQPLVRATLKQPQQVDVLLSVLQSPYQGAAEAAEVLAEICGDDDGDADAMMSRLAAPECLAVLVRALQHGLTRGNVSSTDDHVEQLWLSEPDDLTVWALEVVSKVASVPVLKQMPLSVLAHDLIQQLVFATKVQDLACEAVAALHEHQDWAWVFLASHVPTLQQIAQHENSETPEGVLQDVEEIVLRVQKGLSLAAKLVPLAEVSWRDAVVQLAEAHASMRNASSNRARCKEGNLAYFYGEQQQSSFSALNRQIDHYGYALYDVVCQFDADHVPEASYLRTIIPAFQDPEVGYVALPSICGANSEISWAVRGRLYMEAYMHGPLGASMSKIALPCCIGSHYAVRTAALKKAHSEIARLFMTVISGLLIARDQTFDTGPSPSLPCIQNSKLHDARKASGLLHTPRFVKAGCRGAQLCFRRPAAQPFLTVYLPDLLQVGGIGPELNEDFSTSYILTASGYRGLFSTDTIANGDGPANFEDCMRQEYQWARSAMVLVTVYLGSWWPGHFTPLEMFRAAQTNAFWLVQSYAALLSIALVIGPCLFGLQLVPAVDHSLKAFLTDMMPHTTFPQIALAYCSWLFCYVHGWMRPAFTKFWSYELWMHAFCKPWWILQGTVHGLLGGLLGVNFAIKMQMQPAAFTNADELLFAEVTPKGDNGEVFMGVKNLIPFLFCAGISIVALAFGSSHFLAPMCMAFWHLLVAAIIVVLHYKENHHATASSRRRKFPWHNFLQLSTPIVLLAAGFCTVLVQRHGIIFEDIWWGQEASAMTALSMQEQCDGSAMLSYNITNASMPVINGNASDFLCSWAPDT
eukprot:gene2678-2979_t